MTPTQPDDLLLDLQRLELQVNTLFTHDDQQRLVRVNEPDGGVASRFFLGRTRSGAICRFRHDLPDAIVEQLRAWVAREPVPQELSEPPRYLDTYLSILESHAPVQRVYCGPAYHFPDVIPVPDIAVTLITQDNADLLRAGFTNMLPWPADMPPAFAVLDEGSAVALCFSSRFPGAANEAGVHTLAPYRRRGYAAAVVANWAMAIRGLGRTPLYDTEWHNLASQAVARRLGMRMYADDLHIS